METTPQAPRPNRGVGILGFVIGIIIAFLVGVCVGLHPSWIPIKVHPEQDMSQPIITNTGNMNADRDAHSVPPTTDETTEPTTQP